MSSYQIETLLDLGDIGTVDATVDGTVVDLGFDDPGTPYHETDIQKIVAHIPLAPGSPFFTDIDVTLLVSSIAEVLICESLVLVHEGERVGA